MQQWLEEWAGGECWYCGQRLLYKVCPECHGQSRDGQCEYCEGAGKVPACPDADERHRQAALAFVRKIAEALK